MAPWGRVTVPSAESHVVPEDEDRRNKSLNQYGQLSATGASHERVVAGVEILPRERDQALCKILTREQVAKWLQVKPRQLDRMGVPYLDLGHKTKRYLATDVEAWLESQRRAN